MIETRKGDVLNQTITKPIFIVHGCNAQGVMGSGIALQIKTKYPEAYLAYKNEKKLKLGTCIPIAIKNNLTIINAITQEYYGRNPNIRYVDYEAIRSCFHEIDKMAAQFAYKALSNTMKQNQHNTSPNLIDYLPEIHFPMIGAGLANGDWNIISKIIDEVVSEYTKKVLWVL